MRYHKGKFLYHGTIISCYSDAVELKVKRCLSRFAMPVPGGRIVNFERKENKHGIENYYALYKVNVKLKDNAYENPS